MKKVCMCLLGLLAIFGIVACSNNDDVEPSNEEILSFSLNTNSISFDILGDTAVIEAYYGDDVVYDVTYTVVNESVCEVINGVVISRGDGSTTINVSYEVGETTLSDVCIVNVSSDFSATIDAEDDIFNLASGDTLTLTTTVQYPNVFYEDAGVSYSSSDTSVCTVASDGTITAVSQGIAIITASTNVQITTVTTAMGMTYTTTSSASDSITVVVDNEYDSDTYSNLVATYEGTFDWQGFGESHSGTNWTRENFTWIRAISRLELKEDGSFTQKVLNAKRAAYSVDEEKLADTENYGDETEEEQLAIFTGNCYVYNSYLQEEFEEDGKVFGYIEGYEEKGINNFSESGVFAVFNGELILCYNGTIKNLGAVADDAWLDTAYEPFTNMVAMHSDMTMLLVRQ